MIAATLVYLPLAKMSDRMNRKPFVLLTFAFFALFPLILARAPGAAWLAIAFVVAGLRETGEPARKAISWTCASRRPRPVRGPLLPDPRASPSSPPRWWAAGCGRSTRACPFYAAFGVGVAGCLVHAAWGPSDSREVPA